MATKSTPATKKILTPKDLKEKYVEFVLENNKRPVSVYRFMKYVGDKESVFYQMYPSMDLLEKDVWKDLFDETLNRLYNDEAYIQYSVREKLLGFYYTLIEVLKPRRSYVAFAGKHSFIASSYLEEFKKVFLDFTRKLVMEALTKEEIYDRPVITQKYNEALWGQLLFVLNFWIRDESEGFEKTDEAIDKAVNLSFDLMAKNPLDSLLEFGRYLLKNKFS